MREVCWQLRIPLNNFRYCLEHTVVLVVRDNLADFRVHPPLFRQDMHGFGRGVDFVEMADTAIRELGFLLCWENARSTADRSQLFRITYQDDPSTCQEQESSDGNP